MQFKTKAQQQTYEKVGKYLRQLFGEMVRAPSAAPIYIVPAGTTLTHIVVTPWGNDDATITVRAYVVFGAELAP
ncbi:MAG TPA: YbjN domain-containing protein, partial [Chloroflexi bacterium]|nr:YbjN domain-containing protein [Chloroflexota bacterium]